MTLKEHEINNIFEMQKKRLNELLSLGTNTVIKSLLNGCIHHANIVIKNFMADIEENLYLIEGEGNGKIIAKLLIKAIEKDIESLKNAIDSMYGKDN